MKSAFVVLLLLVGVWALLLPHAGGPVGAPPLDPEPHRQTIAALEAVLYRTSPPELGDAERAAAELQRLFDSIARPDAGFAARKRALPLLELAANASASSEVGYALPDLAPLRRDWQALRDHTFAPAPWFARDDPALVQAQAPRAAAVDPEDVRRLRQTIRRLELLCALGESEVEALGEPEYDLDAPGASGRAQVERWHAWAREWDARIDEALRELPPAPPWNAVPVLVQAHQETGRAVHELRLVPAGAGAWPTPFRAQWTMRFEAARALLAEQRAQLEASARAS
jgi:hypothetical protein